MTRNTVAYLLLGLSGIAYVGLSYFTPRTDFTQLLLLYTFVFGVYVYYINLKINLWHGLAAAILFRLLLLFATPALSDDYFRFVWDGRLLAAGFNPYLYLPSWFVAEGAPALPGISETLYRQLNSQLYFSVYPPVAQAVFWLSVKLAPESLHGSIIAMRAILLLAEVGSILLLLRLLRKMALPEKNVLFYALNPLVILEITGNLHFEGLMIFFLLAALLFLYYNRLVWAGVMFGLAVSVKLLPLLFLPVVLRKLGWRRFILFALPLGLTVLLKFIPLVTPEVLQNIFQSIDLYFRKFEFNASLYYLLRWLGFRVWGYNQIALIGPLLSVGTLVLVCAMATVKQIGSLRRLMGFMAAALVIYLLLATTVHPWYITTLVALTAASHFRFALVWSGLAILTYAAYNTPVYKEDLSLVALEYTLVLLWLVVELYLYRQRRRHANLEVG